MNPQDRPARRFDEPPAYEDLEIRPLDHGYIPRPLWAGTCPRCGALAGEGCAVLTRYRDPEIARHSHLGAIVIVASVVVLVVIAAALLVRGAS